MELRDLLIKNVSRMYPVATFVLDFQQLIDRIKPGTYMRIVPVSPGVTIDNIVNVIVDDAIVSGWIHQIVAELPRNPATKDELDAIQALLAAQPKPTSADPLKEVLLDGNRPFANRIALRQSLTSMCKPGGSPVLVVSGEPKTGKTFSFYLAQYIARQHGFIASQFEVDSAISAEVLAGEVMRRLGVPLKKSGTGLESEQRSGKDLADQVKDAIEERKQKRFFVFDGFPLPNETPLSPEVISFVARLAKYADEELRGIFRIALIRFSYNLPDSIEDIAERDQALPFTDIDMFEVLKQVAIGRGWRISDQVLRDEIAQVSGQGLRERFILMRKIIRTLSETPPPSPIQPAPGGQP